MVDLPADFLASPREPKIVTHEFERWMRSEFQKEAKESAKLWKELEFDPTIVDKTYWSEGYVRALVAVAAKLDIDL